MAGIKYSSLIVVIAVVMQSTLASGPLNFPEDCRANGIGHRLESDSCLGCVCETENKYFCQGCTAFSSTLIAILESRGCTFVQTTGTNFPDCCPKFECPEGVDTSAVNGVNQWPEVETGVADTVTEAETTTQAPTEETTQATATSRFTNYPQVCNNEGIGAVIKSSSCEGCLCTSEAGAWRCQFCTTATLSSFHVDKGCFLTDETTGDYPDCCPKISCPDGVDPGITLTHSWPTI